MKKISYGQCVQIPFGNPENKAYKRGIFLYYSKSGKYGYFKHNKTEKILKRPIEQFEVL